MNSTQVMDNLTATLLERPVPEWGRAMDKGDFPHDYFTNFGAIVSNIVCLSFPNAVAKEIIYVVSNLITVLPEDQKNWLNNEYMPEILKATKVNPISFDERIGGLRKALGVIVKIVYAFLYQEQFLPVPGFKTPFFIWLGALAVPSVTGFADFITGFE